MQMLHGYMCVAHMNLATARHEINRKAIYEFKEGEMQCQTFTETEQSTK
jgi:hypothetical protein